MDNLEIDTKKLLPKQKSKFSKFMKSLFHKMGNSFTILLVPHTKGKPVKLSIPLFIIYIFTSVFFIIAISSSLIVTKHIDYLKALTSTIILENKVEYLSHELIKNRNFLSKLREVDHEMRLLLGLKTKKAVVEAQGIGGPTAIDEMNLTKMLNGNLNFTKKELSLNINMLKQELNERMKSSEEIFNYIKKQRARFASRPKIWPTTGRISSPYGYRFHPFKGRKEFHKGIDIAAPKGTPVLATASGKIVYANWLGGYGQVIIINHGHGFSTRYGHLARLKVKRGQRVKLGQIIGTVGNTGISTGSHLHYEVRFQNKTKNPLRYVTERTSTKKRKS